MSKTSSVVECVKTEFLHDVMQGKKCSITSVAFSPRMDGLSLVVRKHQDDLVCEKSYIMKGLSI